MTHSHHTTDTMLLHDAARREAEALRRQAIDDFWRGSGDLLTTAATRTLRAADRLRYRLARRAMPGLSG
jgi:hypothetical protein